MATGPGHIGYDVFDKVIQLLEEILGSFFAPLLATSRAKLYYKIIIHTPYWSEPFHVASLIP